MQVIRVGLLHVPTLDAAAGDAVRRLLAQAAPGAMVLQESYAGHRHWVEETLRAWCDEHELDLVITLGGSGPAPGPSSREPAPEATLAVVERLLPGLPEAMRAYGQEETPLALLDRGVAGIRGRSMILNLPAGAGAAARFLAAVVDMLAPLLAHLQDAPDAPTLAAALSGEEHTPDEPEPDAAPSSARGLNAADFAAFLRRKTED
jgi:molybdopterin biosynthesis enzyme MoaB